MGCSAVTSSTERLAAGLEVRRHADSVELWIKNGRTVTKRYTLTFSNARGATFPEAPRLVLAAWLCRATR